MSQSPRVALVTGASSGIGKSAAELLQARGFTVYVAARRVERMADLEAKGCRPIALDISQDEQIVAAVKRIEEEAGGVDVLINNAGFGSYGAVEDTPLDDARYQFEVNLFGLARLTQLVLPYMRERGWGRIVNTSSVGGRIFTPMGAWYHATKHALEGWSDCLRMEVQPFGIDVVVVRPGLIKTEFGDVMAGPMLERSGEGPYAELAQAVARGGKENYEGGSASPPEVIGRVILRAVEARRPATRYAAGQYAKPLLFLRWLLPDRWFEALIRSML